MAGLLDIVVAIIDDKENMTIECVAGQIIRVIEETSLDEQIDIFKTE